MTVMLVILLCGILTFRIGRFFFPRAIPTAPRTKYVDAWAEAANEWKHRPRTS